MLLVPDAALVLLGFGRGHGREPGPRPRSALRRPPRDAAGAAPRRAPGLDRLGADVAIVPLPPVSPNQRLSTPNKFWEAIAAGTPVVVPVGLEVMARLVAEHDLGAVAASTAPADLAVSIREVLARLDGPGGAEWREQIAISVPRSSAGRREPRRTARSSAHSPAIRGPNCRPVRPSPGRLARRPGDAARRPVAGSSPPGRAAR